VEKTMQARWLRFLIAILLGAGLGLLFGWVISPVKYVNTNPDSLRVEYKADYVLMVAEVYQSEGSLAMANQRLAMLGREPTAQLAQSALSYALNAGYADGDIALLTRLLQAIQSQAASPTGGGTP
jgi:hypothetical protein